MTTAQQLIDRALRTMRDTAQEMFPDPKLIEYINDSITDLCTREPTVREVANVVVATGTLAIPTDVIRIRWVRNPDGVEVAWLDESTFQEYVLGVPDWPSDAPLATAYDEKVFIHPTPDNGTTWTIGYFGIPAVLTADSDTYPLRRVWEPKTVHYLRAQMYYEIAEDELADREMAAYQMGLRPAQAIMDHLVPGRINLAREPNAFDADPESTHRGR